MYVTKPYDRLHAQTYAETFALSRNALFSDFSGCGGDCTNYISQCIYAGSCIMNYTPTFGWYFISGTERAPAWTGVAYLYNFLTQNRSEGPFGHEAHAGEMEIGDIIQLGNRNGTYYHTLIITGFTQNDILVCAHTDDALNRPLRSYSYQRIRYIHIDGVRFDSPSTDACFSALLNEQSIAGETAPVPEAEDVPTVPMEQPPQQPQTIPETDRMILQLEPEMEPGEGMED